MHTKKQGFTLIELLIVIGVLAVLATVTVLVLNPAELFRQARDSQRIADLNTLKDAINLYLTAAPVPSVAAGGFDCTVNYASDKLPNAVDPFAGGSLATRNPAAATLTTSTVNGTGWVHVDFSSLATQGLGTPLSVLPTDPNRTDPTLYYAYGCDNTNLTFEINAKMESNRYKHSPVAGANDAEGTDGGNQLDRYEVGNVASLAF